VNLCKARDAEVEAGHKLEEANKIPADLLKQLDDGRKRIAGLIQNYNIAAAATKLLQEENTKLKSELAETKSNIERLQQASTEEKDAIRSLEKENMQLKATMEECTNFAHNRRAAMLQKRIKDLQTQDDGKLQALKARDEEKEQLQEEIEDLLGLRQTQQEHIEILEKRLESLAHSHAAEIKGLQDERKTLDAAKAKEAAKYRRRINRLSAENKNLQHELGHEIGRIRRERDIDIDDLRRELHRTRSEYGQVRSALKGFKSVKHLF